MSDLPPEENLNPAAFAEVRVQANVQQVALKAKVIMMPDGTPLSLVLSHPQDTRINLSLPAVMFPFIENGDTVFVTLSIFKAFIDGAPPPVEGINGVHIFGKK